MIKAIVVDLDGTLLNENSKISKGTIDYLNDLKSRGYIIIIATGRSYVSALYVTKNATFAHYIITNQGASIINHQNNQFLLKNSIDKEVIRKVLYDYSDACLHIKLCEKNRIYNYTEEEANCDYIKTTKDKEFILNNCGEIFLISIVMRTNEAVMKIYDELKKLNNKIDLIIMQDSFSNKKWLDIIPKNSSKYNAIKLLTKSIDVDIKDIIAFGDGLNDIEMLKNCGHGVAMKNALKEVKDIANDITDYDYNQNGVIQYLKKYFSENN